MGLLFDLPTIGCAKTRLIGEHATPAAPRGSEAPLLDDGEPIGTVLRTRDGVRPLYVSIGHRVSLTTARDWVLRLSPRFRLPFFMGFTFGVIAWTPILYRMEGDIGDWMKGGAVSFVSLYAMLLLGPVLFLNRFGFDRAAARFCGEIAGGKGWVLFCYLLWQHVLL